MSDQRFNRQFEDVFARSVLKSFQVSFGNVFGKKKQLSQSCFFDQAQIILTVLPFTQTLMDFLYISLTRFEHFEPKFNKHVNLIQ